jgi:hypothetical protein
VTAEIGYLDVDPGSILIHATEMSTGSSYNEDLDATRLHMERDEFLALHDTPPLYTGSAGQQVIVNDDEDALIFAAGVSSFLELDDTPSSYSGQGTKYVRVNTGSSGLEFFDAPGGAGAGVVGVLVHDEGVFLGTGTIINVVGDNISMSLSGSVGKIEQSILSAPAPDEFVVKSTGTLSYTQNNTWEQIKYITGTISVDRECSLICDLSFRWWGTTSNWEYMELQYEIDGSQSGRIWKQQRNGGPANNQRWMDHFQEVFTVQSGIHGVALYTRDGGSSLDRSFDTIALLTRVPSGATLVL